MYNNNNEKWKKRNNEGNYQIKKESEQMEKRKLDVLGNLASGYHQISGDVRKK